MINRVVKQSLNLILGTIFSIVISAAYADSTQVYNPPTVASGSTSAGIATNQTFLLDSGTVDYMPVGGSWIGTDSQAQCTANAPGCVAPTHFKGLCPKNFVPYFVTSPFKSAQTQTSSSSSSVGASAICVANWNVSAGGNYNIGFGLTSTTSNGSLSYSGNAFNWYIYCYPGTYTATNGSTGPNGATYNSPAGCDTNPASCVVAPGSIPSCNSSSLAPASDKQPLLWAQGYFDFNARQDLWKVPINTGRTCPPGYDYFYQVGAASTATNDPSLVRVCITPANPEYPVSPNQFTAWVDSNMDNTGNFIGTKATYNWAMYCYPGTNPGGANHTLNICSNPTTSPCALKNKVYTYSQVLPAASIPNGAGGNKGIQQYISGQNIPASNFCPGSTYSVSLTVSLVGTQGGQPNGCGGYECSYIVRLGTTNNLYTPINDSGNFRDYVGLYRTYTGTWHPSTDGDLLSPFIYIEAGYFSSGTLSITWVSTP